MSDALTRIATQAVPSIAQGIFPDRMTIVSQASSQDDIGGTYGGTTTNAFTNVPVSYQPETTSGDREIVGDASDVKQRYVLRFPAYHNGVRIGIDPSLHRLVVAARGSEPAKTFVILKPRDHAGGMWTVVGELA